MYILWSIITGYVYDNGKQYSVKVHIREILKKLMNVMFNITFISFKLNVWISNIKRFNITKWTSEYQLAHINIWTNAVLIYSSIKDIVRCVCGLHFFGLFIRYLFCTVACVFQTVAFE